MSEEKLVCRCKRVSEDTIIEAIKNGADSVRKVKEKTEANTYGCYGCRLAIKKLIEENEN